MADGFATAASTAGVFDILRGPGGFKPRPVQKQIYTIRHIPGGDDQVLQFGGGGELRWKGTIRFNSTTALAAVVTAYEGNSSGTFTRGGTTYTNAFIVDLAVSDEPTSGKQQASIEIVASNAG